MSNSSSPSRKRPAKTAKRAGFRRALLIFCGAAILCVTFFRSWHGINGKRGFFAPRPTCDVLVLGGTPAGIAAALAAARGGASVVLVEERPKLGGDISYAMLNMFDVPLGPPQKTGVALAKNGIFGEFYRQLGVAFDIQRAQKLFDAALQKESAVRVLRGTAVRRLLVGEKRLEGAVLRLPNGREQTITASAIVDASDDAEFAARAGAGYYLGRENANPDRKMQSAGLLFSVKGVDWQAVQAYVRHRKALSMRALRRFKHGAAGSIDVKIEGRSALLRLGGTSGNYAWERGDIIEDYKPRGPNIVVLSINFGRQDDGSVVLNTINIVGVDGLSLASKLRARAEAIQEIPFLLGYLREQMPGFKDAQLAEIAPELYIRETRHIHGFYSLKVADIKEDRAFYDRIALCSYPLDLHPYSRGEKNPFGPQRFAYTLPLRALVPRKLDGVFVASRSLSATYSAAGSARVIPITMAAGQAAGIAASLCARDGISPHELVGSPREIAQLQTKLRAAGLDIGDALTKK
ncbi:FAD dependent oxidoreductase [Abditibacterium utsteinense]|uniref:FAD dependent oxidoreductase n=1 Tax=Abditibacterium utsteinense TaxID=1960156 RepID=A0A2S8STH7_9BACT|nr:FAD-dependent oxidoreductase [Abditibacterium utsteinense]PQV64105.1 FAD dependent oxidoreductase [Abditibacterium utsteinense]